VPPEAVGQVPAPPSSEKSLAVLHWSLVATTALVAAIVVGTFWLTARTQSDDEWVHHTLAVRGQLAEVLTLVQRAESGQRGYLLTSNETYLGPYDAAVRQLPETLDRTGALVSDNPQQQQAVVRLRGLIADKLAELRRTIEERQANRAEAALAIVNTDQGRRLMDDIRELLSTMQAEEDRLLAIRQASAAASGELLRWGVGASFVLVCVLGALVGYFTRRSFGEVAAARDRLMVANTELLEQVRQRERAEGQLRQSQKMEAIGQLSGGIAHDFNNMLGVVTGALDLMQRRISKGDFGIERYMEAAIQATGRAAGLTHRLLAFARQQPLAPEPIDADKLIGNMSDLLRSTLGEHIQIETASAAGLWLTKADAHQLESAILNIAINARDAMPGGGKLTIETGNVILDDAYCRQNLDVETGQFILIAISDTGVGMPPEIATQVFDPFFTTKPAGKGTGLGLSQVYGFIRQSRGHIKIYSEIGAGTTVKIYLKRLIGELEQPRRSPPQPAQRGDASEVILVVEDNPLMRQMSVEALADLGYTVIDSESAAGALSLLGQTSGIKLLFTDVVMPEMNGRKLADEAVRRRPDLKVLFTTGYTPNAVVHGGVLDPGVNFLGKPFTLEQLATKVRAVLDQ
jgi:signal transduction histidine kinase/CheY-like chemotaxis protein